jgi:Asp-tRNA(Asn)/Glu-tRNA(Gln) amidotransferase C subunit
MLMARVLDPAEVEAMAAALRLSLTGDDLTEVTHRLNALLEALEPLAALPLDEVEPVPILPDNEMP